MVPLGSNRKDLVGCSVVEIKQAWGKMTWGIS